MNLTIDLVDKTEFTTKEGTFVEEVMCIDCPICGELTTGVITGKDVTWYIHSHNFCRANRGTEFIDDAIMYYQLRQGDHSEVDISLAVQCW